jgi:Zn-dependent protease
MAWPPERARGPWTLCGIPLQVDASWFIMVAWLVWSLGSGYFPSRYPGFPPAAYWVMGAMAAPLLFVCVLLHELGHALVARGYGIPVSRLILFIFGGLAQMAGEPRRPAVEFQMALAGPLVSALIAAACFAAAGAMPLASPLHLAAAAILHYLALINAAILVFNLLPGFPLDGGRLLRAALWAWTGSFRRATRMASAVGAAFGLLLVALGVVVVLKGSWGGLWYVFLGWFLRNAALMSYRQTAG